MKAITAQELRIGSNIYHYDKIVTVNGIQPIHIWTNEKQEPIYLAECKGIELTPEILEKCGISNRRNDV